MKRALVVAIVLWAEAASAAPGKPEPHLAAAKKHHEALEFERCLDQIARADRADASETEHVELELYEGLCALELGQTERADVHFRAALRLDPHATLPPYTSPKIVERFQDLAAKVASPPPAPAPAPAAAPSSPPRREPFPSAAPPTLTFVLGAGAVVAAGTGTWLGLRASSLEDQASSAHFESDAYALGDDARAHATGANIAFGAAVVTAAAALVCWWLWPKDTSPER